MMFSYPYFGMPSYNRYSRYGYRYPANPYSCKPKDSASPSSVSRRKENIHNKKEENHKTCSTVPTLKNLTESTQKEENRSIFDSDSPIFQILGFDLYFDDILILCLIFFLYEEGVKDQSLFVSLFLLLLS